MAGAGFSYTYSYQCGVLVLFGFLEGSKGDGGATWRFSQIHSASDMI
jgi:hypothetical protein